MALDVRLELRLAQKLILTPQLQQAIKLLQLPQLELLQALNQELVENPFLEEIVDREVEEREDITKEAEPSEDIQEDAEAPLEKIFGFTTDEYFEERASDGRDLGYFNPGMESPIPFEHTFSKKPDLYDHLLWQLGLSRVSETTGKTCEIIIGNLNEDGYLQSTIEEIAKIAEVDIKVAEEALRFVQDFDPPGVGARNLKECLLLQAKQLALEQSLVGDILREGFEDLDKKKYQHLATKFNVSVGDVLNAVKIIESFEPRPGRNYTNEGVNYIIPDVYIFEADGSYRIMLNDEGVPRLRLSNYYRKLLANKNSLAPEDKQFLEKKLRSAVWLLKSLDQRNKTIYKVTENILKFQEDFFRKGIEFLRPLNLKDVAGELGMHESTVSRVTSNKYLQCPRGLFSFRFFFSSAIKGQTADVSSASVKDIIKRIITEENHDAPLSDQQIVEMLKNKNITIARRTVAKYRDELKISSHGRRKRWS